MKILMVNKFLYPRGGAETYMLEVGQCLQARGHEVAYFGMHDRRNVVGNALHLDTYPMDFREMGLRSCLYPFRIIYSGEAKRKIRMVAEQFRPDVVHLNNINFQLTPSVIDGVYAFGIPIVQTVHDPQMLCPNHMLLDLQRHVPCELCIEGSKWNCARRRCIHGSFAKSILGSIEGSLYQNTGHYSRIGRLICPSRFIEALLLRDRRFVGKTAVLHNFSCLDGRREKMPKGDYVLYFGRLSEEKGIRGFLKACALCPDIPFVVAGAGPLEYLMETAPSNVRYVGFQSGETLQRWISQARFSVYPSVWYENCPLSVLESQALGTPVLANRIGGIPELIEEGQTGMLMDTFTPENYALHIRAMYGDPLSLDRMSENCRAAGRENSLEAYCDKLLDIYDSILEAERIG